MKKIILISMGMIAVVGGSFYGGMRYAQNTAIVNLGRGNFANLSPQERQARIQQFGGSAENTGGGRGGRNGEGFMAGEVIAKDDKSITVKLQDGGSKIVFLSSSTLVAKTVEGSSEDIEVGKQIVVTGMSNQDGSVNAQSIQIRPTMPRPAN